MRQLLHRQRRKQRQGEALRNRKAQGEGDDRLIFEAVAIGNKRNVAYIVGDSRTGEVAIVDVGFKPELVLERVNGLKAQVRYILATHAHRDHMGAAPSLKKATGAPLAAFRTIPGVDVPLSDHDVLRVGGVRIKIIHTPGHTADSICFLVNQQRLITGDTLYVGRLPKAPTRALMRPFYDTLHDRLMRLDDSVEVWPGHDVGVKPSSTIGEERRCNPIIKMGFEDFCNRKWDRKEKRWVVVSKLPRALTASEEERALSNTRSEKGTYILLFRLREDTEFEWVGRTGRLRDVLLPAGFYLYIGSAHNAGGIRTRVSHHLRDNSSHPVWHLDSLRPAMTIEEAWVTYDPIKRECQWSEIVHRDLGGHIPVPGLGSADCVRCPAHFYRFAKRPSFGAFTGVIREFCLGHAPVEKIRLA